VESGEYTTVLICRERSSPRRFAKILLAAVFRRVSACQGDSMGSIVSISNGGLARGETPPPHFE